MSFSAVFYTFSKRINSTKQPTGGTTYNIILKDDSSVVNPTIGLDIGQSGNPSGFNYAYIAAFNRYYFIKDWVWSGRLWWAQLQCDSLASFKTQIGAYTGYVTRSASRYDLRVVDTYYPATAQVTKSASFPDSNPFTTDLSEGRYVIGIQGRDSGNNGGAVSYYVATNSQIKAITNRLLNQADHYEVEEISEQLLMCIFNPMEFIVSCMWFPFQVPGINVNHVSVGWWEMTGLSMQGLSSSGKWGSSFNFTIPKHPKAATRGQYLNLPPYAHYRLEAGPWGVIPLDNFNLLDDDTLTAYYQVDLITGSGRLGIKNRDQLCDEATYTAQIRIPVQLGQNMFNQGALQSMGSNISGLVSSAVGGNAVGYALSTAAAVGDAAKLSQAVPSTNGSNGTLAFNNNWALMGDFLDVADEDLSSRGRPLCKRVLLSSLSGYVLCEDADPAISCTDSELREIVSYLNSGFYME